MTTKEQEVKALDQIRKIIEYLGENSYVATALDGCLEDAKNNIIDDAAYSMKSRYEYSEKQLKEERENNQRLKMELKLAMIEKNRLEEEREQLLAARFSSSLQDKIVEILEDIIHRCDTRCVNVARQLIEAEPNDFQELQKEAKKIMADRANYSNTLQLVQSIKGM